MTKEYTTDGEEKIATGAVKYDAGKSEIQSGFIEYFPRAIEAIAAVSDFGARKYSRGGWRQVDNGRTRYANAGVRHALAQAKGEVLDNDSGLLHLAHETWNKLAVLELILAERDLPPGATSKS